MWSNDIRDRVILLHYLYGLSFKDISILLGPSVRQIQRWYLRFKTDGFTGPNPRSKTNPRAKWSPAVEDFVSSFAKEQTNFYLEELQYELKRRFPEAPSSTSTICRGLKFNLNLTRKVIERRAREAAAEERIAYLERMQPWFVGPCQLVFLDETSKDARTAWRKWGWGVRGKRVVTSMPYARGTRISILAALGVNGFIGYAHTVGTFTRGAFHQAFAEYILPLLRPWPGPNSIVVMDNASIHMYVELEALINSAGAILVYLPPYSPDLNPIEASFGLLKAWILKHAHLSWRHFPEEILPIALNACLIPGQNFGPALFEHCGYPVGRPCFDPSSVVER